MTPSLRRVAVLSTGRQDFGILRSTIAALRADARVDLRLWVGGMHLSAQHGHTIDLLERDGFNADTRLDFLAPGDDISLSASRALAAVGAAVARERPDVVLVVGDRYETAAAALAVAMLGVPLAHLHGGEETEGAVDNALRHAVTKLSHLHFVSHAEYGRRVRQMGEPASTVHVIGPPGLDSALLPGVGREELESFLGLSLIDPIVVVTLHPTTLGELSPTAEVEACLVAMDQFDATWIVTEPNADAGGLRIREVLYEWAAERRKVRVVPALGERRYFSLLRLASAVLGNSSSGLIEAPAFDLPVVNVGDRQKGRLRSAHVRDTIAEPLHIVESLRWALAPTTRSELSAAQRPFPPGPAGPRIAEILATAPLPRPARKAFVDWISEG